ncbi:MAG: GyrI-like domain-containing protein, partial [Umezawaea sp.]
RAVHGVGPGEARRVGASLQSQPRMSFRLIVEGSSSMRYRIVEKAAFRVVGRKERVPLVHEGMNPAIVEFVKGLPAEERERIAGLSDQEPAGVLNVSVNVDEGFEEGTELDFYYAVASGADVPEGLDSLDVDAGTWAVFESTGEFPKVLQYVWRDVYTQWFPSNPYRSVPGPSLLSAKLSEDGATADAALWVKVEKV